MKTIYVLSDSTGETAERVIRAALSQFYDDDVRVHRLFKVSTQSDVQQALSIAVLAPRTCCLYSCRSAFVRGG